MLIHGDRKEYDMKFIVVCGIVLVISLLSSVLFVVSICIFSDKPEWSLQQEDREQLECLRKYNEEKRRKAEAKMIRKMKNV